MQVKILKNTYSTKLVGHIVEATRYGYNFTISGLILVKLDPTFDDDSFEYLFYAREVEVIL